MPYGGVRRSQAGCLERAGADVGGVDGRDQLVEREFALSFIESAASMRSAGVVATATASR